LSKAHERQDFQVTENGKNPTALSEGWIKCFCDQRIFITRDLICTHTSDGIGDEKLELSFLLATDRPSGEGGVSLTFDGKIGLPGSPRPPKPRFCECLDWFLDTVWINGVWMSTTTFLCLWR
jgi:hypothetical protein